MQMVSKANLSSTSCMSSTTPVAAARRSSGSSLSLTSACTESTRKPRSERVVNSRLAFLRCHSHCSPSELKRPWPRKSTSMEMARSPLG
uniref:Predicted protein n=1 Tax=Hordeum vulgare subsp. vulgare TaxID=112509 RepID=F2D2P9_HORVV|nr:predicted protein [Hordeum vulgare subsp. vulgare]